MQDNNSSYGDIDPAEVYSGQVIVYIKGKSAIHIARNYSGRKRNYVDQYFWARGFLHSQSQEVRT